MFSIKTQNKLKEENGKVFWDGKWRQIIVFADLSQDDNFDYQYEYMVTF